MPQCQFTFQCEKKWEELIPVVGNAAERHCAHCDRRVYVCRSGSDVIWHARRGNCVALQVTPDEGCDVAIGLPGPD